MNVPGSINARSVGTRNGRIVIGGGAGGIVRVSGRLAANGGRHHTGGRITITGARIKLAGARINASGGTGGGTVLIGGDAQGGGTLAHAQSIWVSSTTVIRADALQQGNGGKIVLWSDGSTVVHGVLSARGGALGGNGGLGGKRQAQRRFHRRARPTPRRRMAGVACGWARSDRSHGRFRRGHDHRRQPREHRHRAADHPTARPAGRARSRPGRATSSSTRRSPGTAGTSLTLNASNGIQINAPITMISGAGTLALNASGSNVAINSLISVTAAGTRRRQAQPVSNISTTGLVFGSGGSIDYGASDNGGTFSLNGTSYTLRYSMAQLAGINGSSGSMRWRATSTPPGTTYSGAVIGSFSGQLDGLGHAISGLTIVAPSTDNVGLIGTLGGGTVSNIGLAGGSLSGRGNLGGLVGLERAGTVQTSYSTAAVSGSTLVGGLVGDNFHGTVQASYATGAVSGTQFVGGLVGESDSGSAVRTSFATGAVSGTVQIGGLVGFNEGIVQMSYATGAVSGIQGVAGGLVGQNVGNGTVDASYATGAVSGGSKFANGALIGGINGGTVSNSYWDTLTSGPIAGVGANNSGAITNVTGLTTRQLQGLDPISGSGPTAVFFSTVSNLGDGTKSAFSGGTGGLYPYLTSFSPESARRRCRASPTRTPGSTIAASGAGGTVSVSGLAQRHQPRYGHHRRQWLLLSPRAGRHDRARRQPGGGLFERPHGRRDPAGERDRLAHRPQHLRHLSQAADCRDIDGALHRLGSSGDRARRHDAADLCQPRDRRHGAGLQHRPGHQYRDAGAERQHGDAVGRDHAEQSPCSPASAQAFTLSTSPGNAIGTLAANTGTSGTVSSGGLLTTA